MELPVFHFLFTDSVICLSLSPRHDTSSRSGSRNGLQTWRVAGTVLNKPSGQKSNGGLSRFCLDEMLTNSRLKNLQWYEILHKGLVRVILNTVMKLLVQHVLWNSWNT